MSQILASNPPVPPPSLLAEAQLGMYMTPSQSVLYAGIQAASAALANGLSHPDGFIGGAISDIGAIAHQASLVAGLINGEVSSLVVTTNLENTVTTTIKGVDLTAVGGPLISDTQTTQLTDKASDMIDAANDAIDAARVASRVVGAVGLALQLAGNAMQAGVAIYEYAELGSFNTSFNAAIAADNAPLTVSGLQSMLKGNSTLLYSYMTNMVAAGTSVAPIMVAPNTPQSIYESL
jgi:hypothetical protein